LQFEKNYFDDSQYSLMEKLIKKRVLEVLKWGSRVSNFNLLDGRGKTALDVGCAYGYGLKVLESLGYQCYGVDLSKHAIMQAKKRIHVDLMISDVQKSFPFKNPVFDVVTCFEVLEHLKDPLLAIRNIYNSCKDVMIYTTPNRFVEGPIRRILRDTDKTHINVKVPSEWKKILLKNFRYDIVKVETFHDLNLGIRDRLLFFKSFKTPRFGLNVRILIKKGS
jgi:2-polyprenyl-3-methyl-5-hydroxy-6-metoxy-1,4-benzoquinol methylase